MPSNDPRFARLTSDPRFIRPARAAHKVVLDDRFKSLLDDGHVDGKGDSTSQVRVDKYGRRVDRNQHKSDVRAFYRLDSSTGRAVDRARGEGLIESSDEDGDVANEDDGKAEDSDDDASDSSVDSASESDNSIVLGGKSQQRRRRASSEISVDLDEDAPLASTSASQSAQVESAIPLMQDTTRRIAVVNLDWDNVRAIDLFKVFDSVLSASASTLPSGDAVTGTSRKSATKIGKGRVVSVKIMPSEFGKARLAREEKEGPPIAIFNKNIAASKLKAGDSSEIVLGKPQKGKAKSVATKNGKRKQATEKEYTVEDLIEEDAGDEYDEVALRRYQLERLRYYYAIIEFDTEAAALHAYSEIDGSEFEATANVFDLRFVPDDTVFDNEPTDVATSAGVDLQAYKPIEFVTDALRNSKVKLTWDADDPQRAKLTRAAYGLDSKSKGKKTKGKAKETENDYSALLASDSEDEGERRTRIREAFGLSANGELDGMSDGDDDDNDMQITFTPALSGQAQDEEDEANKDETSLDAYQRRERERRQRKKEQRRADKRKQTTGRLMNDSEESDPDEAYDANAMFDEDNGVNQEDENAPDGFFNLDDQEQQVEIIPETKLSKKAAKQLEQQAKEEDAARLALLVGDEDGSGDEGRHFDMHAIMRAEKISNKPKKALKKGKDRRKHQEATEYLGKEQDRFTVDAQDERFKSLHENHEYALDPSNPRYMKTKNMQRLLEESRKRRDTGLRQDASADKAGTAFPAANRKAATDALSSLVASIKRKGQSQDGQDRQRKSKRPKQDV